MEFLGKWVELENIILSEVTQSQKNICGMHSLIGPEDWNTQSTIYISNYAQEEGRTKYGYSGPFLEGKTKIPIEGDTKCGAESEEKTI